MAPADDVEPRRAVDLGTDVPTPGRDLGKALRDREDVVLFGAFQAWAIADFVAARRRDRVAGTARPAGTAGRTLVAAGIGIVAWGVFAFLLHGPLIGVRPFG